jgi:hypothetical protein
MLSRIGHEAFGGGHGSVRQGDEGNRAPFTLLHAYIAFSIGKVSLNYAIADILHCLRDSGRFGCAVSKQEVYHDEQHFKVRSAFV